MTPPPFLSRLFRPREGYTDVSAASRLLNAAKKDKARARSREFHDAMARQLGRTIRWPS